MKAQNIARAVLCAVAIVAAPAVARVTAINITMLEPFAEGASAATQGIQDRLAMLQIRIETSRSDE